MDIITNIEKISDQYNYYILDIWGVLHNGIQAYPGVANCLQQLKSNNRTILLLSNSPNRAHYIPRDLSLLGIDNNMYDHVITSGESTHRALASYKGKNIYCFHDDKPFTVLEDMNIHQVDSPDDADVAVIFDLKFGTTVSDYQDALKQCLDNDLTLICANPDKVVDVGGKLYICGGALADQYQDMGGTVSWHGKPHKDIYDWAFETLGNPDRSDVLAIGDSMRTDVTGAAQYGIDVLWNSVGIHLHEITSNQLIDQSKVDVIFKDYAHRPTAILTGLTW